MNVFENEKIEDLVSMVETTKDEIKELGAQIDDKNEFINEVEEELERRKEQTHEQCTKRRTGQSD